MIVTKIEGYQKGKYKVFLNDAFAFVLYRTEIKKYQIEENQELPEERRLLILQEVLLKRAKLRAMHILKNFDRTEKQLRDRLKENFYPEEVIDDAVIYVKSYHYIDDTDYARRYATYRKEQKSRRQIVMELRNKGVSVACIEDGLQAIDFKDQDVLVEMVNKRCRGDLSLCNMENQKLLRYFLSKGFSYDQVRDAIKYIQQTVTFT